MLGKVDKGDGGDVITLLYIMSSQLDAHPLSVLCHLPIRKSQPVNSFQEKMHSSSLEDSLDMREFLAILQVHSIQLRTR